jgi:hypothetical protein
MERKNLADSPGSQDSYEEEPVPIELFEPRNKATCKFCGQDIYWIYSSEFGRCYPYDITTRLPHPQCIQNSNLRIWKYK